MKGRCFERLRPNNTLIDGKDSHNYKNLFTDLCCAEDFLLKQSRLPCRFVLA
jgi:hypothetical protein